MIPIIVLKIQYQVIYNQSNLSFQTYFEEFISCLVENHIVFSLTVHAQVLLYNPALMYHIYHDWIDRKGRYPSSGSLAIFFALQYCDEVRKGPKPCKFQTSSSPDPEGE